MTCKRLILRFGFSWQMRMPLLATTRKKIKISVILCKPENSVVCISMIESDNICSRSGEKD